MNLFDVSGKKVIFTGATGGLGQSMAEGLLEAGAEVVLVGASGRCRTLAEEYRARGWKAHGLPCDLASTEEIRDCFGKALDLLGGEIDVLVNAAGIQRRAPSEDFPLEDWQAVIDVNLTAPFLLSRLAGKQMIRQGRGGRIINIASMCSYFGGSTIPAYSASKGGIAQLTKAMCNDWAKYGITVNAIAPGYMDTPMNAALTDPRNPRFKEISDRIPAGRWGTGEDMKGLTIFLASGASDYINGAVIPCDGGYLVK
ncbi:MAG: SDR family oxidoreductase [Oscillospiraceae bacterium]|jgi:2-deoxy-D-gluconate 3-dehydrogenase|nr:SDR family oxidoreductase [Oscillibacter sp.]OKZ97762.1 MAG: 2-deoxy-D-gluconate 3-dehydrogenase [Clostridiales bacterium 42_27]